MKQLRCASVSVIYPCTSMIVPAVRCFGSVVDLRLLSGLALYGIVDFVVTAM